MKNWSLILKTESLAKASIIKGMLEENNVPVSLLNKQDSSYVNFGEIEVYVPSHLKEIAGNLLSQSLMN